MPRTTIRIEQYGMDPPRVVFRVYEPGNVPHGNVLLDLNCDVAAPPFSDLAAQATDVGAGAGSLVREAGLEIFNRLSAHPGARAALDLVDNAAPGDDCPIYLHMTTDMAEALPFETLCVPGNRFLALDERSPIVRIAIPREPSDQTIERLCDLPLRVTAVISAAESQMYEEDEWRALYDAFRAGTIDFKLQVLVGRDDLRQIIQQTDDPRVEVRLIEHSVDVLERTIAEFEPALLHFFCHGITEPEAYLEVASRATCDLGDEPLYLNHEHIRRIGKSLWLVTLNACQGAAPVPDAYSLALAVANNGVPAVVGMRETIEARDANIFTRAFYQDLLQELHRVISAPHGEVFNWPVLMRGPRDQLRQRQGGPPAAAAATHKRWSLPVLYMRPENLRLRLADDDLGEAQQREIFGELQVLRAKRGSFVESSPPEMLKEIDQRIAYLEQQLGGPGPHLEPSVPVTY